jgi:hypothetical protein
MENIVQNGVFNFANPSSTPNGLNGLYGSTSKQAITKLDAVDATLSTPNCSRCPRVTSASVSYAIHTRASTSVQARTT